jgi:Transcriptional regulator
MGNDEGAERDGRPLAAGLARKVPVQQRSREKYERILDCAAELIAARGDAFTMSDIVEASGVAFGSLYQYFPDRSAVIGTLAERYNALGRACVEAELGGLRREADLHGVLCRIVDGYHRMFLDHPVMRDIWLASQGDRMLQALDAEDGAWLAGRLADAVAPLLPEAGRHRATPFAALTMVLIAAAVRDAISRDPNEAADMLALFKAMLPRDLAFAGAPA